MCGISGLIDFRCHTEKEVLQKMTNSLAHRGPDDAGMDFWELEQCQIGFGHRRLSIMDLSPLGHQPMHFEHLHIVLNGEIYNFAEIRAELIKSGYSFISNSDTEVVLKAFHYWGANAVTRFIGMFAFVIYDESTQKIYLFRDRAGVKPLYYYWSGDLFLFASELKAFHCHPNFKKDLNNTALVHYMRLGYIPAPQTIFKQCSKLEQGHWMEIDLSSCHLKSVCYWDVDRIYQQPILNTSEEELLDQLESLLLSACNYRMVADVPVGVFLSGGYDSSLVTAMLQKERTDRLKTFTIGFEDAIHDEAPFAREIAAFLGTNHYEYFCKEKEAQEIIPLLPILYDEPMGDSSAIPTTLVSKMARKEVTVALSADGGDEIFAGYNTYAITNHYFNKLKQIPGFVKRIGSSVLNKIPAHTIPFTGSLYNFETRYNKAGLMMGANSLSDIMAIVYSNFTEKELHRLLPGMNGAYASTNYDIHQEGMIDPLNSLLAKDYKIYMCDDILTKVDRATMSVGLEGREPLLDHRIIELMAKVPGEQKFKNGVQKYLLKKLTHKYVPEKLLNRPKKGFSVPLEKWFKGDLAPIADVYLDKKHLIADGIFDGKEVEILKSRFMKSDSQSFQKLWFIIIFQMWKEKWL